MNQNGRLATQPRFDNVRMVLGESNPDLSATIKGALGSRGLRGIVTASGAKRLFEALDAEIVDLLLYDYDMLGSESTEVMQRIRRRGLGRNPFVVVVATVRETAIETVRRLINGGIDDLIRKPVSIDRLFESIGGFTQSRKPFVVSYGYVGPTRRVMRRPNENPKDLIEVPNTLRSRAIEGVSDAELQQIVDTAIKNLDERQLESFGVEIDILAKRIADFYGDEQTHEDMQDVRGALYRLEVVGEELRERCRGTGTERVGDLATMLIALAQRVLRSPTGNARLEVELLGKLATAIRRALSVERHSVDVMREIADAIATFTQRH